MFRLLKNKRGVVATSTLIYAGIAIAGIATSASSAHQERKSQKAALAQRALDIQRAEEKSALAETRASEAAQTKLKKFRLAQTRSILTSPLGVQDEAVTGKSSLLGG